MTGPPHVEVDKATCVGSGWCVNVAGSAFRLGTDGKATVTDSGRASVEEIEDAVDGCPVSAISMQNAEN